VNGVAGEIVMSGHSFSAPWVDEDRGFGSISGRRREGEKSTQQYYRQGDRDHYQKLPTYDPKGPTC
jgi:hypothetical protein